MGSEMCIRDRTSISVAANADGVAETPLFASPGTVGEVNVLAASPVAAEHVKFAVFIHHPGFESK